MLAGYYRPNQNYSLITAPLFCLLLWAIPLLNPLKPAMQPLMPLYGLLYDYAKGLDPLAVKLGCYAIILLESYYLHHIAVKHEFFYKRTNLALLTYPLLMLLIPEFATLHAFLFVNAFLLLVLDKTLALYKTSSPINLIFDTWVVLSLASLFYLPVLFMAVWLWVSLAILRPFSWREWVVGLLGLCLPYFFAALYFFWNDRLHLWIDYVKSIQLNFNWPLVSNFGSDYWGLLILLFFVFLLSIFRMQTNFYKNSIRVRSYQQVVLFMLFGSIIVFIAQKPIQPAFACIFMIPLSLMFSYFLLSFKRPAMAELIVTILIAFHVVYQLAWLKSSV